MVLGLWALVFEKDLRPKATDAVFNPFGRWRVDHEKHRLQYQPESWRSDDAWFDGDIALSPEEKEFTGYGFTRVRRSESHPEAWEQIRVLELLGRINYKIIKGNRVYIEAGGVVYKTLYGGYWRSVFTGVEHYLFRCEQVSGSVWAEESDADTAIDLPIVYSDDGWTANGQSLSFMLSRD
jgi:hypothetical protein